MLDNVSLHSIKTLLENYRGHVMYSTNSKFPLGQHMKSIYMRLIEDVTDIDLIEIERVSPRKWQIVNISTSDDSYNVEDDELFLSPANFDLKVLTEQKEIYQYNSLFGIHPVSVSIWELERFPDMFKVYDENGKELSQAKLKAIRNGIMTVLPAGTYRYDVCSKDGLCHIFNEDKTKVLFEHADLAKVFDVFNANDAVDLGSASFAYRVD